MIPMMVDAFSSTDKFGNPAQNTNPYGFTAPMGPASQALVPYYNKVTGESWTAPSGGYTPPSADWIQGSPNNSQIAPLPGFAPGMDPVQPTPRATIGGITAGPPPGQNLISEIQSTATQQPYMPVMTSTPQQQPTNQNMGGLNSLLSFPRPPTNPVVTAGGLNALTTPQVPRATGLFGSTQPFARNRPMPIAGSLPSLRMRPTFTRSLPVPFARPPLRR